MRSATAEAPRRALRRGKSLRRRVVLASAAAAAIGGATAALAAGTVATGLLAAHDEATALAAAEDLASEVAEEVSEDREELGLATEERPARSLFEEALLDELDDVDLPDARARIDGAEGLVAGDARLPRLSPGECKETELAGRPVLACTVALGGAPGLELTLVTSAQGNEVREDLLVWAALVGFLVGALLGGLVSHRAAVWALGPLFSLARRIGSVDPVDPRPEALDPPLAHEELEQLRRSVAELVERLAEALARARGFSAEAAHELRTPLTTIAGELELLAEAAPEESAPAIAAARRRVDDLVALVQRLLVLAQPDAQALAGAVAVDLGDVLEATRARFDPEARARIDGEAEEDVLVRGDASLLSAMLSNAVDNALKFSSGPVRVRIRKEGGEARIEVSDEGPGIADEERERIFEPFYRSRAARASGARGHGIGLALVAHVARVHGGSVGIDARPGEGTRLVVRIPVWRAR